MYTNEHILFQINLNKFPIIGQINENYKIFILEEIFSLGYNAYLRNYIKNENILIESNSITENKTSSKGILGESIVYDILINKFSDYQIENTSKIAHSGDIQVILPSKNKIIVEVKNYNKTIDQDQIEKIKFDMKFSSIYYAIFISLNSGIVGKKKFEIEIFYYNKQNYYIIYLPFAMHKISPSKKNIIFHNNLEDSVLNLTLKLEYSICIISSIAEKFCKSNIEHNYNNNNLDEILNELNKYYDEYKIIKNSAIKMEENIKKILDNHLITIKDYENNIKNNINKLINKKIINNINKKINIEEYNKTVWNIFVNNIIFGKICIIKNKYDLLINYNNITVWEEFDDFDECKKVINKILV